MEILFQEFSTPTLTSHPPSLLTFLFPFEDNNEITHVSRPPAEAPYPFFPRIPKSPPFLLLEWFIFISFTVVDPSPLLYLD